MFMPKESIFKEKIDLPNLVEARIYSPETLVENTPESSVHKISGCSELYKSTAHTDTKKELTLLASFSIK